MFTEQKFNLFLTQLGFAPPPKKKTIKFEVWLIW